MTTTLGMRSQSSDARAHARAASAMETNLIQLVEQWRMDAQQRRAVSPNDVSADVLNYCANKLIETLLEASNLDEEISVADYAELHDKATSTVRRWCATGVIAARPIGREYRIRRGEPCPNLRLNKAA